MIRCCIFILFVCCACQKSGIDSFDIINKIVDYDSIYSDEDNPFNRITDMEIVDSILITKHANDEYYFSFIDVNKRNLIRRWGKRGRGPKEYVQLGAGFTICNSDLVFLDRMKKEINYMSFLDIINGNDTFNIIKESYPYTTDFRPRHLAFMYDKKIAVGAFKNGYFGILDSKNNTINCSFDYPFTGEDMDNILKGTVYQTKLKTNITQNKFVILTLASDIFEIYQMSGGEVQRIFVSPFDYIPFIHKRGGRYGIRTNESIAGLMKMAVSDDFICFSYSSESFAQANKKGMVSDKILCFDWNGRKIKQYILPFPISTFCIDQYYIYGVRYFDCKYVVYRFKL